MACEILIPQSRIELGPLAVRARSPNHWTTREIPVEDFLVVVNATISGEHPSKQAMFSSLPLSFLSHMDQYADCPGRTSPYLQPEENGEK